MVEARYGDRLSKLQVSEWTGVLGEWGRLEGALWAPWAPRTLRLKREMQRQPCPWQAQAGFPLMWSLAWYCFVCLHLSLAGRRQFLSNNEVPCVLLPSTDACKQLPGWWEAGWGWGWLWGCRGSSRRTPVPRMLAKKLRLAWEFESGLSKHLILKWNNLRGIQSNWG